MEKTECFNAVELAIDDYIEMIVGGTSCNIDYNHCSGVVSRIEPAKDYHMVVLNIKKGKKAGCTATFSVGEHCWHFQIREWDE
jgi:hypothetical protein